MRPWDADAAGAAAALLKALPPPAEAAVLGVALAPGGAAADASAPVSAGGAAARSGFAIAGASVAGSRSGGAKENQDTFLAVVQGDAAFGCVMDGHGKYGAEVASEIRKFLEKALPHVPGGRRAAGALRAVLLASDTALHLNGEVDARLSGAAVAVVRVELLPSGDGGASGRRRVAAVHLGDCRVILGRREGGASGGSPTWQALRLTKDHLAAGPAEASRIVAEGGCVRSAGHKPGEGALDIAGLDPPRLWSRLIAGVPGLDVSRALGDALGQTCGLSPDAAVLEAPLGAEDLVVVVASDGVFGVLSDGEVLQRCLPHRRSGDATGAASAVVSAAGRAWARFGSYRDDASCVVIFI